MPMRSRCASDLLTVAGVSRVALTSAAEVAIGRGTDNEALHYFILCDERESMIRLADWLASMNYSALRSP
jgi:hypothetical protein